MRRREFLRTSLQAGMALPAGRLLGPLAGSARAVAASRTGRIGRPMFPKPALRWRGPSSVEAAL
jgi:hypothetical protein